MERVCLMSIEDLYAGGTESPDELPITDAERALLDTRLTDMERNPDDQSPWPEVKDRLKRLDG
jgi:putative addiction module component (TIGR02574 family)